VNSFALVKASSRKVELVAPIASFASRLFIKGKLTQLPIAISFGEKKVNQKLKECISAIFCLKGWRYDIERHSIFSVD